MSVRNAFALFIALSTLALLVGCGGGSSSPPPVPPPNGGFSNSNLSGTYVFSVSGTDVNNDPVQIVGSFTANGSGGNGKGGITGGTLDIADPGFEALKTPVAPVLTNSPIASSSSYTVSVDGRGQATLVTSTPFGDIILDFVLSSSSHGLVTEFDGNASGSGTLDLQSTATLAGAYAFSLSGSDGSSGYPLATVGAFTVGSGGTIAGAEDFNDANLAYPNEALLGTVALGPSSTPSTTLETSFTSSVAGGPLTFDVYAIDSTHLKFIETDAFEFLAGDAYSQPSATVSSGSLAFTLAGFFPFSPTNPTPVAAGGFMVANGGNITTASTEDVNEDGSTSTAPINFSATYSNTGSQIPGRFTLTDFSNFFGGTQYAAYPSSGGLLLLEIDDSGLMVGAAYPPQSSTAFTPPQGFGLNFTGINLTDEVEVDDIAEFATASTGGTFTGLVDENFAPGGAPITPPQVLDGTFTAPDANGRGSLITTTLNNTLNGGLGITFYSVDGTTFPFVETDTGGQVSTGVFVLQNANDPSPAARSHMFVPQRLIRGKAARQKNK